MKLLRPFVRFFRSNNRAAVAITMAIMTVPLMIVTSAAIDMSRIMIARSILQSAVDAAAGAGAGAWGTSSSSTNANNVTTQAFTSYASNVTAYAPLAGGSPTVSLICTGGTTNCGTGTYTKTGPSRCNNPCVFVTASVNLTNTLFAYLAGITTITVNAGAGSVLEEVVTSKNIPPSPGFGSAGDHSDAYAYAVQSSGATSSTGGTAYNYGSTPPPNQNCGTVTGTISLLPETTQTGATNCNYLFIADSESAGTSGAGGSITLAVGQPIAFTFIDDTGGHNYTQLQGTANTTQLVVSKTINSGGTDMAPTYEQNGYTINNIYNNITTVASCSSGVLTNNNSNCSSGNSKFSSSSTTTGISTTATTTSGSCTSGSAYYCTAYTTVSSSAQTSWTASAYCPAATLYGLLSSGYGAPTSDNIGQYNSAPEVLGYPPTYSSNHALAPFVSNNVASTAYNNAGTAETIKVQAICPNYSRSNTNISAPINSTYASDFASYYSSGGGGTTISGISGININIYSTAFPGVTSTDPAVDTSGRYNGTSSATPPTALSMAGTAGDIFSPNIAGCTPATAASDNNATTTAANPWWNWNGSNLGNCDSTGKLAQTQYYSTPGQPSSGDCALLIQPLGTAVPTVPITVTTNGVTTTQNEAIMPDYYLIVSTNPPSTTTTSTIVALDPIWDGQTFPDVLGSGNVITSQYASSIKSSITVLGNGSIKDSDTAPTFNTNGSLNSNGYTPTNGLDNTTKYYILPSGGTYAGDYVFTEQPAASGSGNPYDFNLPGITSSKCYNPQNNGNPAGSAILSSGGGTTVTDATIGDQNNATITNGVASPPADPIANPQLGAIVCTSNPPETYALYWNDMGTYTDDDLGYWNAVFSFTCPVPGSTTGGGPTSLFQ